MILRPLLATVILCHLHILAAQQDEPAGIDAEEGDAEVFYNKTYIESQSALEKVIFSRYRTNRRPVLNESLPIVVDMHWNVVHSSVNQEQQTLQLHGIVYMMWVDELLGWDPDDFNGIRMTRCKKWQVWNPKIRVANSVSGVFANFEIASQAHVLIQTIGKDRGARMEMYPTFSIRVGCAFDYSAFPNDENKCTIAVVTPQKMNEVILRVYGELPPTLMFGWGGQASKRVISDFEITNVTNTLAYYRNGNTSEYEPITAMEQATTWSVMCTTVFLRRHSPMFFIGVIIPCMVSMTINLFPFLLPSMHHATYALVANIVLQAVFLQDLISKMPLVVSAMPNAVLIYGEVMSLNALSLGLHLAFMGMSTKVGVLPEWSGKIEMFEFLAKNGEKKYGEVRNWPRLVDSLRILCGIALSVVYFISYFLYFLL